MLIHLGIYHLSGPSLNRSKVLYYHILQVFHMYYFAMNFRSR